MGGEAGVKGRRGREEGGRRGEKGKGVGLGHHREKGEADGVPGWCNLRRDDGG